MENAGGCSTRGGIWVGFPQEKQHKGRGLGRVSLEKLMGWASKAWQVEDEVAQQPATFQNIPLAACENRQRRQC